MDSATDNHALTSDMFSVIKQTLQCPQKQFYVYSGTERFPLDGRTNAIGVVELARAYQSVI